MDEQILILRQQLQDYEILKEKLVNKLSDKKKEHLECQKKINSFETKIKHLKDTIKDKENCIESMCIKLEKKENQIKELLTEIDTVKKAKTMIELILNKTNIEIEALHEENKKSVQNLLITIEDYKNSEELSHKNIMDLQNNVKQMKDNLENKTDIITFYENKAAEYYLTIGIQEEQLKTLYQEKLTLQSHLKDMTIKTNTQEKIFSNKQRDMENTLEYHLDELKDIKNTVSKLEEILCCKQNEIDQQNELISYQKNITETLQSDKCTQEINIKNLNNVLDQKSTENIDLEEKIQEFTLNINTLKEQLNATLNEKNVLEENVKTYELQIKTTNTEFDCQINNMKNILESQSNEINHYKIDLEKLKETLTEKQNDFNKQLIISNKQIETISHLRLEKYEFEEKLKSSGQIVLNKENELKILEDKLNQKTLKIKDLSEKVILNTTENNFFTQSLNMINVSLINMQEDFDKQLLSMKTKLELYDNNICAQTEKLLKLKNYLLVKVNELNNQIEMINKQKGYIACLETEKHDLFEKFNTFDQCLLDKNTEIMNLEKKLENHHSTITDLKEQLCVTSIVKLQEQLNCKHMDLELQKQETEKHIALISNLTSEKDNLINETNTIKSCLLEKDNTLASNHIKLINYETQLEELHSQKHILESELNEIKVQLECTRHDIIKKEKISNEQVATINALISEKNHLTVETNKLKECLTQNENALALNQNKEDECKNALLMFELNELKNQLNYLRQESAQKMIRTDKHVCEVHEQLSLKQSEIKKQIDLKNDSLVDIYRQIYNLKTIKNELELVFKKEKTEFETCLETYSINFCNNKPILDHHENSLMEVITSADTFIEQNGIQVALVEHSDDYSVIERLKNLFDALKMFIININTQGNKREIMYANNDYTSNDAYAKLLATSNKYVIYIYFD